MAVIMSRGGKNTKKTSNLGTVQYIHTDELLNPSDDVSSVTVWFDTESEMSMDSAVPESVRESVPEPVPEPVPASEAMAASHATGACINPSCDITNRDAQSDRKNDVAHSDSKHDGGGAPGDRRDVGSVVNNGVAAVSPDTRFVAEPDNAKPAITGDNGVIVFEDEFRPGQLSAVVPPCAPVGGFCSLPVLYLLRCCCCCVLRN